MRYFRILVSGLNLVGQLHESSLVRLRWSPWRAMIWKPVGDFSEYQCPLLIPQQRRAGRQVKQGDVVRQ